MKVLILALALTCVAAVPANISQNNERIIDQVVANAIKEFFERAAQHDPVRGTYAGQWHLPGAPNILSVSGYAIEVRAVDFSKLNINVITYDLWSGDFLIEVEWPSVDASVDSAYGEANIFDNKLTASGSGRIAVRGLRARGTARIALGAAGVDVSNVNIQLNLAGLTADIQLEVFGRSVGGAITRFLNNLPGYVITYAQQITAVLNYVAARLVDRYL